MIEEHNGLEILDVHWFNQGGVPSTIGIVITKNGAGEVKARIGTGLSFDKDEDIIRIVDFGGKVLNRTLWQIIKKTTDPEDPLMKMIEYIREETFPENYLKALFRITTFFNWSKESEKDILDFAAKLYEKYNQIPGRGN